MRPLALNRLAAANRLMAMALGAVMGAAALSPTLAQTPHTATHGGSAWAYFLLETSSGFSLFSNDHSEAIITVVSRDGRALGEADRPRAAGFARALCERSGRQFNTRSRGYWINHGWLGFHGDCRGW